MDITRTLKAVILLDTDGQRFIGKYFDEETGNRKFEKKLFLNTKAQKIKDEILVIRNMLIVHRFVSDLHIYVIGSRNENPIILDSVLRCIVDVLNFLLTRNAERKSLHDHLSHLALVLDEICDSGMILETDPNLVYQRVASRDDIVEQSMAQKLQSATEHIRFPWLRS